MKKLYIFLAMGILFFSASESFAKVAARPGARVASGEAPNCSLQDRAQISLTSNEVGGDLSKYKNYASNKIAELQALAKENGLEKVELQSYNFGINPYNQGQGTGPKLYTVYTNMNFDVSPADKALDFITVLEGKGFSPSLNVNSYQSCE